MEESGTRAPGAQTERLKEHLTITSYQGSFYRLVTNRETYEWLAVERLRLQTETLILEAQDDVQHTRWYRNTTMKHAGPLMCRKCGKAMEIVKHT